MPFSPSIGRDQSSCAVWKIAITAWSTMLTAKILGLYRGARRTLASSSINICCWRRGQSRSTACVMASDGVPAAILNCFCGALELEAQSKLERPRRVAAGI